MRAPVGGHELEYETFGDPAAPTFVLLNGLGSQLIASPSGLCEQLAVEGFHVVRYDHRDVGRSTRSQVPPPGLGAVRAAIRRGEVPDLPYTLSDLAADAVGLLDHLGVERAHVSGVSMGGMVVQHLAIEHPDRLISATSIMSTTGAREVGAPTEEAWAALTSIPPADRDGHVEHAVRTGRVLAGPHFDPVVARRRAEEAFDRSYRPDAAVFQLAAIWASGDRTDRLRGVEVPFLVIHGRDDRLIDLDGGEATARAVPGARLLVLRGMGHDLPEPLWPRIVDALAHHAASASSVAHPTPPSRG
ncbi:MAG: alpha/beta fold hydrolase [Actinomycetota bacterium]